MPRRSQTADEVGADAGGGFTSVRGAYDELGAAGFYAEHGSDYSNPHEDVLKAAMNTALSKWRAAGLLDGELRRVLDLACGSGEASLAFEAWVQAQTADRISPTVEACDPFTGEAYLARTGRTAHAWSFEDIAGGILVDSPPFDLVLASFCLHLLERCWTQPVCRAVGRPTLADLEERHGRDGR